MTNDHLCPPAMDVLAYVQGRVEPHEAERIERHLAACAPCAAAVARLREAAELGRSAHQLTAPHAVPADIRASSSARARRFRDALHRLRPSVLRLGQIWTARVADGAAAFDAGDSSRLVVVLTPGGEALHAGATTLLVAPLSLDTAYRGPLDLLVAESESALGYPFMVEVWNEIALLDEQFDRYLGDLEQPAKRFLGLVYRAHLGLDVDLSALADRLGPAILHEADPRRAFQEREIEACAPLRAPALALVGAHEAEADAGVIVATVGDLVRANEGDLAALVPPADLAELEADSTPLEALVDSERQAEALAAIMDRLALAGPGPRRTFVATVMEWVADLMVSGTSGGGVVYARRQRGRSAR